MSLALLIPLSLAMGVIGVAAFLWAMRHHQFEDLDGAAWRVLLSEANGEQQAGARIDGSRIDGARLDRPAAAAADPAPPEAPKPPGLAATVSRPPSR